LKLETFQKQFLSMETNNYFFLITENKVDKDIYNLPRSDDENNFDTEKIDHFDEDLTIEKTNHKTSSYSEFLDSILLGMSVILVRKT
jgi:hypothetical protein